jgi:hypothetical protein
MERKLQQFFAKWTALEEGYALRYSLVVDVFLKKASKAIVMRAAKD